MNRKVPRSNPTRHWAVMCNHLAPPSCLCFVLHLNCLYFVTLSHPSIFVAFKNQSPFHSFHLPPSILFILLIIVHHFHIYHIWPYSCYIVIQRYLHDSLRNTILLKYIHSWADVDIYASKPNFANITDPGLETQLRILSEVRVKNRKNAVLNIWWLRLSPREWPRLGCETTIN